MNNDTTNLTWLPFGPQILFHQYNVDDGKVDD